MKRRYLYTQVLFHLVLVAMLAHAWQEGWLQSLWEADITPITTVMLALFGYAQLRFWLQSWRLNRLIDEPYLYGKPRAERFINAETAKQSTQWLRDVADWLPYIGLVGTVLGFWLSIRAAQGAFTDGMSALQAMLAGLQVGFGCTVSGAAMGLWAELCHLNLRSATMEIHRRVAL